MRQLFAVMALLCVFANLGCTDFENNVNETKPPAEKDSPTPPDSLPEEPKTITGQSLQEHLVATIDPTTDPEKYMVYFSWPNLEDGKRIRIRKEQILSIVPAEQTSFSHEVSHNQSLTYTFEVLDTNSYVENHFSKLVHIPKDFVVSSSNSEFLESQKLVVNRLFINQGGLLRTNGFEIKIVTNQLIVDHGIIETFPENSKAGWSTDGRSGGSLHIKANSAAGDLKIFMRGEHGGDGQNGEAYGSRAQDGRAPTGGKQLCRCVGSCRVINGFEMIQSTIKPLDTYVCKCKRVGANGTNAHIGAEGRPGGRAGNGGNSGTLKVEVTDGSAFFLQTFATIGVAGTPGTGGPGQQGGIAPKPALTCGGTPGADGTNGGVGPNGSAGTDGTTNLRCIFIATESKNDCF